MYSARAACSALARASSVAAAAAPSGARLLHSSAARLAPPALTKVNVDGKDVEVPSGFTVFQACEAAGVTIPRFCYHDRLSIAGNCRMCLVEVEKSPKPVASCAMPLTPGMRIKTTTPLVKKAREGVMEFLLANHPLDCPICDQGGECDLQDQSMYYGTDRGRMREYKRTVEDKNLGPLVKTVMTRCIHCTRCVRFTTEVCGVTALGTTGRGNAMEIGTYVDRLLDSEMSGNVIDLCPVGALTSKPFAFTARPWELLRHESIDVHDALGANIRIDTRGPEVMRVLPRLNEEINEEWISDKVRFAYDGLKRQRLDEPLLKNAAGEFKPVSWAEALETLAGKLRAARGSEIMGVVGDMADAEAIIAFKDLLTRLGSPNLLHAGQESQISADARSDYLFNSRVVGIEDSDVVLLVGSNPRMESPVLASRLRKVVRNGQTSLFSIGPEADLAMAHTRLGAGSQALADLAAGKAGAATNALKAAKRPMVIVGMAALQGDAAAPTYAALKALRAAYPALHTADWNGFNILHTAASRPAALELGFVPGVNAMQAPVKVAYLLGSDALLDRSRLAPDAFVVYAGHHGDAGAEQASLVLPSPAYSEKSGTYMNLEGRVQRTNIAVGRLALAREDWAILRALSEVLGKPLPYDSLEGVRARLSQVSPVFDTFDTVEAPSFVPEPRAAASSAAHASYQPYFSNFFQTDPIARASKTMAKASAALPVARNSYVNRAANVKPGQADNSGTVRNTVEPQVGRANL